MSDVKKPEDYIIALTQQTHRLTSSPPENPPAILAAIKTFQLLHITLPENAKNGQDTMYKAFVDETLTTVKSTYSSMLDLLSKTSAPALLDPHDGKKHILHEELYHFVQKFHLSLPALTTSSVLKKPVVVVALPSGTLMALACVAVSTYYTLAPMTPACGAEQFRADVEQVGASAILVAPADVERLGLRDAEWVHTRGVRVFVVEKEVEKNTFGISLLVEAQEDKKSVVEAGQARPNTADDIAILLFTSGTSGTKKLVPISLHSLIVGTAFVIESWGLSNEDTCLNMMPLYHIGGLIRNLFGPLLSCGKVICCSSFDPTLFFDLLETPQHAPTWYYASPSMHAAILSESYHRTEALKQSRIRLICNAAGGLLPTLAIQLKEAFNCTVLPSYGMTECMPIASPPLSYDLSRTGTSGTPVGVEVAIQDAGGLALPARVTGNICVRGGPVLPGYLIDRNTLDPNCFSATGWFSTGDTGYLDEDGYLYITGRTKEIINRGGEVISPFEVEECIMSSAHSPISTTYGRVAECVAFSVPHAVLQEVVGIGIVTPEGKHRVSLPELRTAIKTSLHSAKWPVVVVYMSSLPKARGKVLRIGLSERLDMPDMLENTKLGNCYFEADCPSGDADIKTKVPLKRCEIDCKLVAEKVKQAYSELCTGTLFRSYKVDVIVRPNNEDERPDAFVFGAHEIDDPTTKRNAILEGLRDELHGYLIPSSITFVSSTTPSPRRDDGTIDEEIFQDLILCSPNATQRAGKTVPTDERNTPTQSVIEIFAEVLSCSTTSLDNTTDFFAAGGDSLGAGRLLSLLRRRFKLRLSIETLFSNSRICDIAKLVEEQEEQQQRQQEAFSSRLDTGDEDTGDGQKSDFPGYTRTYSSTNPFVLILHLLPIALFYPLRIALWWTLFLYGIAEIPRCCSLSNTIEGRLLILILIMVACTITVRTTAPILGIFFKWIVIGRYRQGMYPMWGWYHSRWWIVQKVLQVCGKGIFNTSASSRKLYYRLLGTKIGKNVVLHETAQLGEYDLIEIGDNVVLDKRCICRPFAAEKNTSMLLSRINIGRGCTIGLGSVIAPGAVLPDDTCVGANSSSWEAEEDADEKNRDLVTVNMMPPHWLLRVLVVEPIAMLAWIVGRSPWIAGLIGLVQSFPKTKYADHVEATSRWYTNPKRIGFHFLARIAGDTLGPIMLFIFVVLVKRILDCPWICGPVTSGVSMKKRGQMQKLRRALLERLVPEGDLGKIAALFGSHYEIVSVLVRMLGGQVGQRVYWPGVGPSVQDFELLNIGNDVVFGSRAHLVTSDQVGSATITLADGCMVADRVVVQPGTTVGERAILGSGALTRRNASYPADSVWVGSKAGDCINLIQKHELIQNDSKHSEKHADDKKASTPFGRAFYEGKADYFVLGLPSIICYSLITTISVSLYWNISTILAVKALAIIVHIEPVGFHKGTWYRPLAIFAVMAGSIAIITALQAIFALALVIGAKWSLMGQRSPGSYDWDKSSYCQRWQILLTVERIRRNCYGDAGIIGLLTGTHYVVLYFRALGASVGRNCALFANGSPSLLFTEPDLLTLGDRVAVDNASLVSHINSKGNFKLNKLEVGNRSVLRTGSRLLSGASLGEDAFLLEHTLVMAGDYIDAGDTYQGWPASVFDKKRV